MRQFLEHMTGLSIYPMLSLVFFMVVFGVAVLRALTLSSSFVNQMKELPIDDNGHQELSADLNPYRKQ